jgi:hypothetical protein
MVLLKSIGALSRTLLIFEMLHHISNECMCCTFLYPCVEENVVRGQFVRMYARYHGTCLSVGGHIILLFDDLNNDGMIQKFCRPILLSILSIKYLVLG